MYCAYQTWRRHLTRSSGVTAVWVMPQERMPPMPHSAKYLADPNSHEYCRRGFKLSCILLDKVGSLNLNYVMNIYKKV